MSAEGIKVEEVPRGSGLEPAARPAEVVVVKQEDLDEFWDYGPPAEWASIGVRADLNVIDRLRRGAGDKFDLERALDLLEQYLDRDGIS